MMNVKRIVVLMTLLLAISAASVLQAATVGYWRFENAANFLEDSGPNNLDLTAGGSPAPYYFALPTTGDGSCFPDEIPETGQANNGLAEFSSTGGVLSHADSPLFEFGDFTIEVLFHRFSTAAHMNFIGQYSSTDNQRGWAFGVRASSNDQFYLYHCESGSSSQYLATTLEANDDDDYYAAVSYSASGSVTFYLQNLTDGTPLSATTYGHSYGPLFNSTVDLTIGNMGNGSYPFAGVLDEIRLSNIALSESQLLVTPCSVPEPSMLALLFMATVSLLISRRRQ